MHSNSRRKRRTRTKMTKKFEYQDKLNLKSPDQSEPVPIAKMDLDKTEIPDSVIKRSTSRPTLIAEFITMSNKLKEDEQFRIPMDYQSAFGPVELNPVNQLSISELMARYIGKPAFGHYFLCRTIVWPVKHTGVHLIVDDPKPKEDKCISLILHNYIQDEDLDKMVIPVGTKLAIKNPYLRVLANGLIGIVVYNPAEIVVVRDSSESWGPLYQFINAIYGEKQPKVLSSDGYRRQGDYHMSHHQVYSAIRSYLFALSTSVDPYDAIILTKCSMCFLLIGRPHQAIECSEKALKLDSTILDAIKVKIAALGRLGKDDEALKFLGSKVNERIVSENDELKNFLRLNGSIEKLLDVETLDFLGQLGHRLFCLEHKGPVQVQNPGKGRGIIVTENVSAGSLLIASRAFDLNTCKFELGKESSLEDFDVSSKMDLYLATFQTQKLHLITSIALRLKDNPELMAQFYQLDAGPEFESLSPDPDIATKASLLVDVKRIEKILSKNALCFTFTSNTSMKVVESCLGIWVLPSLIRHSPHANANFVIIGDFLLIVARKEILAGSEVLISLHNPTPTTMLISEGGAKENISTGRARDGSDKLQFRAMYLINDPLKCELD